MILTDRRLIGLDIFRIVAAAVIFAFHSRTHFNCYYGVMDSFVSMGAIFMTGFFMLSGFVLYYTNSDTDYSLVENIIRFWKKRVVSILPVYYFTALMYVIFLSDETAIDNVILAPMEVFVIQANFSSVFGLSHNGGTWFISCLMIMYFLFPFLKMLVKQISVRNRIIIGLLIWGLLIWSPIVVWRFELQSIYSNPFFRCLEFVTGMIICSFRDKFKDIKKKETLIALIFTTICLILVISVAVKNGIATSNYMFYAWMTVPCFAVIISCLSFVKVMKEHKLLQYMSSISYAFFLAQFFSWPLSGIILERVPDSNLTRVLISLTVCLVISIIFHEFIEKPIKYIFMGGKKKR